jgi:multisubunit Na+/H+ antiporter MnhG subunit
MKAVKYLLVLYAFFVILVGPALHIAGNFYNRPILSTKEYLVAALFFIVALVLYTKKDKEVV